MAPGTTLSFEDGRISVRRFWQPEETPLLRLHDSREYAEGLADILLFDGPLLFRGLFYDLRDVRITKDHRPLGWYQGSLHMTVALHVGRCSKIVRETNPPGNRN